MSAAKLLLLENKFNQFLLSVPGGKFYPFDIISIGKTECWKSWRTFGKTLKLKLGILIQNVLCIKLPRVGYGIPSISSIMFP